ncbi:MAG TPA: hypothetical protein VGB85_11000, partial [Nannocystis sp.]
MSSSQHRWALAVTLLVHCGGAGTCPDCGEPARRGVLARAELDEVSGIVASSRLPDVLYVHNDAGDSSRFFAISPAGADLGVFAVKGAQNVDWEDMGRGPCPAGSCLYIGDIGDNDRDRLAYALYRIVEPTTISPGEHSVDADRLVFTYPDGAHDAETLLVHPVTGEVTIVTKVDSGTAQIFVLPRDLTTTKTLMATAAGELVSPSGDDRFTGGAIHPDGVAVLLRTSGGLFWYPMQPAQT